MFDLTGSLADDGRLAVFLFHGVIEPRDYLVRNYTRKHIPATKFRTMMEVIARRGRPMSMDDVVECCTTGKPFPRYSFAITFDDGFENNASIARPILDRLGIPATIYVTSRFVEENAMSWIDRIEWAFERVSKGLVRLPWSYEIARLTDRDSKIPVLDEIRRVVKSDPRMDVDALVADVFRQLNLEEVASSEDQLDKKLTWRQVHDWQGSGFIVGGHSHTHSILSFLKPERLAFEIDTSLEMLRGRAGIVTKHYSYPEGFAHCYSPEVVNALKARGVVCSPTAIAGLNASGADPFHLRRIMVN